MRSLCTRKFLFSFVSCSPYCLVILWQIIKSHHATFFHQSRHEIYCKVANPKIQIINQNNQQNIVPQINHSIQSLTIAIIFKLHKWSFLGYDWHLWIIQNAMLTYHINSTKILDYQISKKRGHNWLKIVNDPNNCDVIYAHSLTLDIFF